MVRRSNVGLGVIAKQVRSLLPHPWIASQLIKLEAEKQFFNVLFPKANQGLAKKIRQVSIRITDICNLRCHTCGQWGDSGFLHDKDLKELKKDEVQPERYMELFTDLVDKGHKPNVYFWGGEPTLYDGLLDLIDKASSLGLPPSIATNGTRLSAVADRFVKAPLFLLQVSIDGHDEATHNAARPAAGRGNNFRDIRAGLEAVGEARKARGTNLPLIASLTVVHKNNYNSLVDIYESFRDKVDFFVFYPSWWISQERAEEHVRDFSRRFGFEPVKHWGWIGDWRPEDYRILDHQIRKLRALSRPLNAPAVTFIPAIDGVKDIEAYYTDHTACFGYDQCVSIFQVAEINSNGDVSPCRDYHDYVVGNVKDQTITEIWNSPKFRKFRESLNREGLMPVCSRCCGLMGY